MSTDSSEESDMTWIEQFCRKPGNQYFCEVEDAYIEDNFNLFGLKSLVPNFNIALSLILDYELDCELNSEQIQRVTKSAEVLYGMIHYRYVGTYRGLSKMLSKYKKAEFGSCSQSTCEGHPLLPIGESDVRSKEKLRLYCPNCEKIFDINSNIDASYFGTSFIDLLFFVFPEYRPIRYPTNRVPRCYGFKLHPKAYSEEYRVERKVIPRKDNNVSSINQSKEDFRNEENNNDDDNDKDGSDKNSDQKKD